MRVLPALDELRGATDGFREPRWLPVSFGLDQEDKLSGVQRRSYAKALNALLLPRLMVRLQTDLQKTDAPIHETFDALKFYGIFRGPIRPKEIVWPSREGPAMSRVVFQPGGCEQATSRTGPWSAIRLFDAASRAPAVPLVFEVEAVIAEGATGLVLRARHRDLGHLRAIKTLRPDRSSDPLLRRLMSSAIELDPAVYRKPSAPSPARFAHDLSPRGRGAG